MAVKTDISKAYDRLEWSFIRSVLERMGFHHLLIQWLMQCVITVSYSFLFNDEVVGNIIPQRGVRQGDPLSPYLFILCGEVLSGLCSKAQLSGNLPGIRVSRNSPRINHLLFADDTMLFTNCDQRSCATLKTILQDYENASGQMINASKSSISFSAKTPLEDRARVKEFLGIEKEGGVGKYLGLPEHFGRNKKDLFASIVDRMRQRAVSYSSRFLSSAGKATMLQAVLSSIPSFAMTCFELPISLCNKIQSVLTRFWWDAKDGVHKICWVAWNELTLPKSLGGLGFRDVQIFNQALLAKIGWRIITRPDCLLARILLGKYCHKSSFLNTIPASNISHGWRGILHGRDLLLSHLGRVIGNGESTRLWSDSWICPEKNLKPIGPVQQKDQDLLVSDLLSRETKEWNKAMVENLLPELATLIYSIRPSILDNQDSYIWSLQKSGDYSVKSGYYSKQADKNSSTLLPSAQRPEDTWNWKKHVWNPPLLPKLKHFLWRIAKKALPTGENLQRRGINANVMCCRCGEAETLPHIFFHCAFAKEVWKLAPLASEVDTSLWTAFKPTLQASYSWKVLPPYGFTSNPMPWICWFLWISRNNLIFQNRATTPQEIILKSVKAIREWESAQPLKSPTTHLVRCPPLIYDCPESTILCYTDAAWRSDSKSAGLAWIFTDLSSQELNRGSKAQDSVASALMAEGLAIREALQHAISLNFTHIWIRSDSQVLIQAITTRRQSVELFGVLADIDSLAFSSLSPFSLCRFSFVSRSRNGAADKLAKACLSTHLANLGP
ncbi:uncharacterized protein LOC103851935 [Brassica rapa]|nr:uncharacterized protein LOC103851935 [Brassica rapa]